MNKVEVHLDESLEEVLAEWLFQYDTSHHGTNKTAAKLLVKFLEDNYTFLQEEPNLYKLEPTND